MRRFFTIVIIFCIIYFIGGWLAVNFGWMTKEDYFAYTGIVGGLTSVVGLIALTRPAITQSDMQAIEISTLKSLTETSEQLKSLETSRAKTEGHLIDLENKKKEMELLVKKASLVLFLKEQYSYQEKQIIEEINKNEQLRTDMKKASTIKEKLEALNEEIEIDPNVKQLKEIIASASKNQLNVDDIFQEFPPLIRSLYKAINIAFSK